MFFPHVENTILLINYFTSIREEIQNYTLKRSELNNVKYISMDLYDNFRDVAQICFPDAIICADSFHVTKHLTDDFNKIRLRCARNTETHAYEYLLRKFHFVFCHNVELDNEPKYNRTLDRYVNLRDIRDLLFAQFPELKVAYHLKELYLKFNQNGEYCKTPSILEKNFDIIKDRFADSGIVEYNEFYSLLANWKQEILNSFTMINGRRINNSYIESKNRILKSSLQMPMVLGISKEHATEFFTVSTSMKNLLFNDRNGWSIPLQPLKPNNMV